MIGWYIFGPKCTIKEDVYFKYKHYVYVAKHFDKQVIELWCHGVGDDSPKSSYFLGRFIDRKWIQPDHYYSLEWHIKKGCERLIKEFLKSVDKEPEEEHTIPMKKKENVVFTRDFFVKNGSNGQAIVKKIYGKSSAQIRQDRIKELSPVRKLTK